MADLVIVSQDVGKSLVIVSVSQGIGIGGGTGGVSQELLDAEILARSNADTALQSNIDLKADVLTTYTKSAIDLSLSNKADVTHSHSLVTTLTNGFMSYLDKIRLDAALLSTDISAWAKSSTKPSYTASEVGAYTISQTDVAIANATPSFSTLTGKPTTLFGYGITDAMTATAINSAIAASTPNLTALTTAIATTSTVTGKNFIEGTYSGGATTGTITPDAALGSIQTITLTGAITLNNPINMVAGQSLSLIIKQPAIGTNYVLTSSPMLFAGAGKILSVGNNQIDIITILYSGGIYLANLSKGYA